MGFKESDRVGNNVELQKCRWGVQNIQSWVPVRVIPCYTPQLSVIPPSRFPLEDQMERLSEILKTRGRFPVMYSWLENHRFFVFFFFPFPLSLLFFSVSWLRIPWLFQTRQIKCQKILEERYKVSQTQVINAASSHSKHHVKRGNTKWLIELDFCPHKS